MSFDLAPLLTNVIMLASTITLLLWRTRTIERDVGKLSDKIDGMDVSGHRISTVETEVQSLRTRLHKIEGKPDTAFFAAELTELRTSHHRLEGKIDVLMGLVQKA